MIEIQERPSVKLPCLTSLFFKIPFNRELFDILVQAPDSTYNNKTFEFEFAITMLKFLVNSMTEFDEVKYLPLKVIKRDENVSYDLKFRLKPYSYQLDGINYGLNHEGWLLLDDQGLGKTLQMIYLAETLKKKEGLEHCLIICGVNSLKFNWESEIHKCSNLSCRILGQTVSKKGRRSIGSVATRCQQLKAPIEEFFVITNKDTLANKEFIKAFRASKNKFDMIVCDEIHKCNNPSTASSKTLLKLKAKYRIGLSGTIIMNDPEDTYVPLKWTGNYSGDLTNFKKLYDIKGGFNGVQVIGHKNLDLLQELVDSCSLRRLKEHVLDLPERVFVKEYVELGPTQRRFYDEVSEKITAEIDLLEKQPSVLQELTMYLRLRQITAFPGILSSDIVESAKLDRLKELVEIIVAQGSKVVIFSTFKLTAYEAQKRLSKYNSVVCTGDQNDQTVNERKDKFQNNKDCKLMIATWSKMGTGHTLTAANYVIFIDTPWTYSDFMQAADRVYRIGQFNNCTIITLLAKDTYDERVQEIIDSKEALGKYVIDKQSRGFYNRLYSD